MVQLNFTSGTLMITPSSYNYSPQTLSPLTPSYNYSYVQSLSNVSISSHPSIMPFGSNSLTVSAPISANCNSCPMMSMGHTNIIPFQQANNYNGCGVIKHIYQNDAIYSHDHNIVEFIDLTETVDAK